MESHPEDSDSGPRTVRRSVWFDHAEHAMKLPADKERDEEVV